MPTAWRRIAEAVLLAAMLGLASVYGKLALWALFGVAALVLVLDVAVVRLRRPDDGELPWRDDRRDLAHGFELLADHVEGYLDDRAAERPKIEADNVAAALREGTWEGESEEEIRRRASDYSDTVSRAQYLLTLGPQAGALFDRAVEYGVVAPHLRGHFAEPKDHAALEQLPAEFREVARRLGKKVKRDA